MEAAGTFEALYWWHWCIAGLLLVVLEVLLPGVFLLWIGLGALGTGFICVLLGPLSWQLQCLIFVPLTFFSLFLGMKFIRKARPSDSDTLNRRAASCVGRTAEVTEAIKNGKGRIKLGDSLWLVHGPDCPKGSLVRITGGQGSVLFVVLQNTQAEESE